MMLGWRLVWRDRWRSLSAMAGIAVAVLIAFVEMGFMNGVLDSQLRIVAAARGDLVALDHKRQNLDKWDNLPPIRLAQMAAVPGVAAVLPVYQAGVNLRASPDAPDKRIIALAFPPDDPPLELAWSRSSLEQLREPGVALFDRASRPIYGDLKAGDDLWVAGHRLHLAGFVELGPSIVIDGVMAVSEATLQSLMPGRWPIMAVIRLAPGADPEATRQALQNSVGSEVDLFRPRELAKREIDYLRHAAPIGLLFGAGMAAGLFVGLVICYQVLYVAIRRRIEAFATLKAMGFGRRFILATVLQQALLYAVGGFLLGLAAAALVYLELGPRTGLDIHLTLPRAAAVALACVGASILAGLAAARQVLRSDPAELY